MKNKNSNKHSFVDKLANFLFLFLFYLIQHQYIYNNNNNNNYNYNYNHNHSVRIFFLIPLLFCCCCSAAKIEKKRSKVINSLHLSSYPESGIFHLIFFSIILYIPTCVVMVDSIKFWSFFCLFGLHGLLFGENKGKFFFLKILVPGSFNRVKKNNLIQKFMNHNQSFIYIFR